MHARKVQAMGAWLPAMSVSESAISTTNPLNAFGLLLNEGVVQSGQLSNVNELNNPSVTQAFGFAAVVSETVFQGGKRYFTYQASTKGEQEANLQIKRAREQLISDVTKAYFNVVVAEKKLKVIDRERVAIRSSLSRATESYREGGIDKTAFDEAKLEAQSVELSYLKAQKAAGVNKMQLARLMGVSSGSIRDALSRESFSLPPGGLSWARSVIDHYQATQAQAISAEALSHRADYQASVLGVKSGSNLLSAAHSGFWPALSAQGIFNEYAQGINTWGKQDYTVMGTLSWSIINGLSDKEESERSHARLRQALYSRQDLKSKIVYEVERARSDAKVLESTLEFDEQKVNIRSEEEQVEKDRVAQGIDPPVMLLDAEVHLADARLVWLSDKIALMDAGVDLLLATGELGNRGMVPGAMEVSGK
jgi:outer membrane protein TolC